MDTNRTAELSELADMNLMPSRAEVLLLIWAFIAEKGYGSYKPNSKRSSSTMIYMRAKRELPEPNIIELSDAELDHVVGGSSPQSPPAPVWHSHGIPVKYTTPALS